MLAESSYANGADITYTYDSLDRVKTKTTESWIQTYTYDKNSCISRIESKKVNDTMERIIDFEYDGIGRLINSVERDENGNVLRYTYNKYNNKNQIIQNRITGHQKRIISPEQRGEVFDAVPRALKYS